MVKPYHSRKCKNLRKYKMFQRQLRILAQHGNSREILTDLVKIICVTGIQMKVDKVRQSYS